MANVPPDLIEAAQSLGLAKYQRHIFLCADQTEPHCAPKEAGLESWEFLKKRLKELNLAGVIVIGTFAAITGESVGYWLGRRYGRALIKRLPLVGRLDKRFEDAERYFRKRGGLTVAIGRYATAAGSFVPFVAGMSEMPYQTFLAYDVPAIAVWATGITLVGYYFGRNLDTVERILSRFGYAMLGVLVVLIAGQFLWKRLRTKPLELAQEAGVDEIAEPDENGDRDERDR